MTSLINAHGGGLVDLVVDETTAEELKQASGGLVSVTLTQRQLCDLELLMNGAFSPLAGFMSEADYGAVVDRLSLADGSFWPVPIVLDITEEVADKVSPGDRIALRDSEGFMPAVLTVESIWRPDRALEAEAVYGTRDQNHPGVRYLLNAVNPVYVGGRVEAVQAPMHADFEALWDSPAEMRAAFAKMGWRRVVAFQTSKPMHRLQREITLKVAKEQQAHILLHPTVGMTKPGDLHYYARVHCYQAIRRHFPQNLATLSLLPLAMRMAGPREALWHAIVHQNYGCSHLIVGPKHAAPPAGAPASYEADAARSFIERHADRIEIDVVHVEAHRYVRSKQRFMGASEIASRELGPGIEYTDAQLKQDLAAGESPPDWFSYPEVVEELRHAYPPRSRQGFTLFFTGLSGSGKSTLAKILYGKLVEGGRRPATLLDGDIVRQHLSSELGFSKAHRDINIRRIGYVASEITKNGGIAICAPIAPYRETRRAVREMIEERGAFIEIYVATSLEVCETRDRKGLYAKARKGIIPEFTGISDPYEVPEHAELRIDTGDSSPMEAAQEIYLYLLKEGYIDS
jgi:sulfate adenylyltransferase